MTSELAALRKADNYSKETINSIRNQLSKVIGNNSISIVTVGSFARREASDQSDLDFFVITDDSSCKPQKEIEIFRELISKIGVKMPSASGAFNETELRCNMTKNIGGLLDDPKKLTRRMLFLLEGEWLHNQTLFDELFNNFVDIYVKDSITEHQLCRFLLNDVIRYYRTIGVDFEHKTAESDKSWGDRNIKLLFSRKLLYFSGILVVAETVQHKAAVKRDILRRYLRLTPIERMKEICGSRADKALVMYDDFLGKMSSPTVRKLLKATTEERGNHALEFRTFKNNGHHFTWELSRLLTETYDASHPIHNAIKF